MYPPLFPAALIIFKMSIYSQDVKRYNVFNDIFRYQDETFEDTEVEESANGTGGMILYDTDFLWREA